MKTTNKNAQLDVLNRIAYMLDEYSVQYVASQDKKFKDFVDNLNASVDHQANKLLAS